MMHAFSNVVGGKRSSGIPRFLWAVAVVLVFLLISVFLRLRPAPGLPRRVWSFSSQGPDVMHHPPPRKIAKVSMQYGPPVEWYQRALQSHQVHARNFNHPMHVLSQNVTQGGWNKPWYLVWLLLKELSKPADTRAEWFLWFDADTVLLNPQIPLQVFLPPSDFDAQVHMLMSRDRGGVNSGVFLIRVHSWSVQMITKSLAMPLFEDLSAVPSSFVDQSAMALAMQDEMFREGVVYVPRSWFNLYGTHKEAKPGDFMVHFPGRRNERQEYMEFYLDKIEKPSNEWSVPLADTSYSQLVDEFWDLQRHARATLIDAKLRLQSETKAGRPTKLLTEAITKLNNSLFNTEIHEPWIAEAINKTKITLQSVDQFV